MSELRSFIASIFGCLAVPFGLACLGCLMIASWISGESIYDTADEYLGEEE